MKTDWNRWRHDPFLFNIWALPVIIVILWALVRQRATRVEMVVTMAILVVLASILTPMPPGDGNGCRAILSAPKARLSQNAIQNQAAPTP